MQIKFSYILLEFGWAECTVEIDERRITVSASYLSDALGDLSSAVVNLLRGELSASATFSEEPGEFRWQFDRQSQGIVRIRIFWNMPRWNGQVHDPSIPIFDAVCQVNSFAGQFVAELQRLLREFGEDGYRACWTEHDFPKKHLDELEQLLRIAGGGPLLYTATAIPYSMKLNVPARFLPYVHFIFICGLVFWLLFNMYSPTTQLGSVAIIIVFLLGWGAVAGPVLTRILSGPVSIEVSANKRIILTNSFGSRNELGFDDVISVAARWHILFLKTSFGEYITTNGFPGFDRFIADFHASRAQSSVRN